MDLADVTVATFASLVGETFSVAGSLEFVLESATTVADRPGGRDPFSLAFRGPAEPLLPQAIYALEHPATGVMEIFVVPIGRDETGVCYQAIFT